MLTACHIQVFVTRWTAARQAPLSMEFSGKNIGVGGHFLLQEIPLTWNQTWVSRIAGRFFTVWAKTTYFTPRYFSNRKRNVSSNNTYRLIFTAILFIIAKLEAIQISVNSWIDTQIVVYSHNTIKLGFPGNWASLVAQTVKHLPAVQETQVQSMGQEDPLEKGIATHSSILTWRSPWTKEPGGLQSEGLQSWTQLSN